jgi:hypothetical protein
MSIDVLRSGGSRTALSSPAYSNSALTSISAGVTLGVGFDVTDSGLQTHTPYPGDDRNSELLTDNATISPIASAMLISAGAARTGITMAPPPVRKTGVTVRLINRSSFNHTFAVAGTSFVADGGNQRLLSYSSQGFTWVEPDARWYAEATK